MRDPTDPREATAIGRLKRRADFLRAAKGKRWHGKALSLQAIQRGGAGEDVADARVGFTLTRKVGGAVIRNRARRRLKEALRLGGVPVQPGHDYVVIGRIEALRQPFDALKDELARAVAGIHAGKPAKLAAKPRRAAMPKPETARTLEPASETDRPHGARP